MPPALAKKVQRYNELHGNTPKVPKVDKLQKPFKARHEQFKPKANMAIASVPLEDPAPIVNSTPNTTTEEQPTPVENLPDPPDVEHKEEKITPSGRKAEANTGSDYMNFLFPSGGMASIQLPTTPHIPADYIKDIVPTANNGVISNPLTSTTSTSAEIDEIFTHNILTNHKQIKQSFQADWGANVIIVNDRELYTEFVPCQASLNPIDGVPINGIKGYGTVIFKIGERLVPVREVAYMPKNPQCTFTTSHIQRLNGFLPGIHSMHSSVKLVNPEGISTKYIPTKINALDYIDMTIIVTNKIENNNTSNTTIKPTANSAKILSAQLIHQKCGHFFHERVVDLAKKKLIKGLPARIPLLDKECPICIATKAIHHPRRPPADYTLLKAGQQLHMDFCFIATPSIRGHTAILCIKCANTRKAWCFPCPNKRSPLDIISFFIRFLEKDGFTILEVRVDED